MKIKSLFYRDNYWGWEFETSFQDFNLLVGISGSGKSQILNAILALKNIAKGAAMNGVEWQIHFESIGGKEYVWKGKFKNFAKFEEGEIVEESIANLSDNYRADNVLDGVVYIFYGEKESDFYLAENNKSLLAILKREEWINLVQHDFDNIVLRDYTKSQQDRELDFYKFYHLKRRYDEIDGLDKLRKLKATISEKLIVAKRKELSVLAEIKDSFISLFPEVTDWDFFISYDDEARFTKEKGHIQYRIKIANNPKWIPHNAISSGMLRTLNHFIEINLCSDHTIFLIDEYENSLGTNCINVLAEDLLAESMRLQFIITSHHPYIINNIPMENWLVLSRHAGKISVHKAAELGLGISKHEHYLQLINSPIYNNIQ